MSPIFIGLFSALFGAVSNVLAKTLMRFTSTREYIGVNFAVIFILLIPFAPSFFVLQVSLWGVILMFAAIMLDGIANYLYFKSFEITDAVTASLYLSLSPLFTLLLLPLFGSNGESIGLKEILAVLVIFSGILILNGVFVLFSPPLRETRASQKFFPLSNNSLKSILIPTLASLVFGFNVYLIKQILNMPVVNAFSYYFLRAGVISGMMFVATRPKLGWITPLRMGLVMVRAGFVIAQWMLLLSALELGNPAAVKVVSDTPPLFVLIFAALFLGEQITWPKFLGACSIVLGFVLLAL